MVTTQQPQGDAMRKIAAVEIVNSSQPEVVFDAAAAGAAAEAPADAPAEGAAE
jgi:hypothetical protein